MKNDRKKTIKDLTTGLAEDINNFEKAEALIDKEIKDKTVLKGFVAQAKEQVIFTHNALTDFSNYDEDKMTNQEFYSHIGSYNDIHIAGGTVAPLISELEKQNLSTNNLIGSGTAICITASSLASSVSIDVQNNKTLYPNKEKYFPDYTEYAEFNNNIEFIKKELKRITPDISKSFDEFIKKMIAHPSAESKCQELIGFRSSTYFKLIFAFAEHNKILAGDKGGRHSRFEQISYFVTNDITPPSIENSQIQIAEDLYKEMSSQSTTGDSVKLGIGTDSYLDGLYARSIGMLASLLTIRKKYYS